MRNNFLSAVFAVCLLCAMAMTVRAANAADAVAVPGNVQAVFAKFCVECHGAKTREADVRLDALTAMELTALLELLSKAQEQIAFGLMPPKDAERPSERQQLAVSEWITTELRKHNAPTLDDKMQLPNYGNRVDHARLFSGEIKAKPYTPARRWLVSPQIFTERVFDVLKLSEFERTGKRPAGMYGVTNPFTLPERSGVRDYDLAAVDGGHFLVMQTNANWIADRIIATIRIRLGEPVEKVLENKADRWYPLRGAMGGKGSKSWAFEVFETVMTKTSPPTDEELSAAIQLQFANTLQRPASDVELRRYRDLTRAAIELGGNTEGLRKMLVAVLLESEFVYRLEFGAGEPDEFGRRMLSPREASYAIAYALGDKGPDETLVKAAQEGRLQSKTDYEREIKRLLADVSSLRGPVDPAFRNEHNEYISTSHPKLVRFFREFFGYPLSLRVFKDVERSDGLYRVPDRGTNGTPGFLTVEADRVVARIVEADRDVFESLLTTDQFFVYHNMDNEKGEKLIDGWRTVWETLKDTNWRQDPEQVAKEHAALLQKYVAPGAMKGKGRGVHETDLSRIMTLFEVTFGRGGRPFTTVPWAHGNRFWHSPFYNLPRTPREGEYDRDATFDYHPVQPFAIPNRKGILTHPAWLIAHSQNAATDPIRRGKWIREKLLAGNVPDVPITVDAQIPEHPDKTLRERLAGATQKQECWKCHQHMNPLGLAFEMYDDFGRYRTAEALEHPSNVIAQAKVKNGADTYKTAPLVTTGTLDGTGDPTLDGDVRDALDMIDRLAKSTRVRQSIIRHAFRFYLGRNELLSDSQTLLDADRAYVNSGGSFKAVVVSLLTSDSFMYRK